MSDIHDDLEQLKIDGFNEACDLIIGHLKKSKICEDDYIRWADNEFLISYIEVLKR